MMAPVYEMAVEPEYEQVPEQFLILAVIQQALDDLQRPAWRTVPLHVAPAIRTIRLRDRRKKQEQWDMARTSAKVWLLSEADTQANRRFSIQWCCRMVGQDCGRFQQRVRQRIQAGVW